MKTAKASVQGFTLVEMLVSTTLLVTLLIILTGVVNQTAFTLRFTKAKVEEFRVAREGFESLTRRLSQATLNTYWDYKLNGQVPVKYIRQSDLRFYSGSATTLTGSQPGVRPGHSIFFQAPLGSVSDRVSFDGLGNLVNMCGYYVEFNNDGPYRPSFLNATSLPQRYRYRLMELFQPSEQFYLYSKTSGPSGSPAYNPPDPPDWITTALPGPGASATTPQQVRILAENVVALVFLPKLSAKEDPTGVALAPKYTYNTAPGASSVTDPTLDPTNQLPPLVQVTLVALDENSAIKAANGSTPPNLGIDVTTLFDPTLPGSAGKFSSDLQLLEAALSNQRLSYRVFTTTVSVRAAKWSRN